MRMYGGEPEDYLPDVEVSSATVEIYRAFSDMGTQWKVHGMSGVTQGLDYSAAAFVLKCHGIEQDQQTLRDLRVLEAAALSQLNKKG